MLKYSESPNTDPCSKNNVKEISGTVLILVVHSKPQLRQTILQQDNTGVWYAVISENPDFFPLMQTAFASGRHVTVVGYSDPNPPEDPTGILFPAYRACYAIVS